MVPQFETVAAEWQEDFLAGSDVLQVRLICPKGKLLAKLELYEPLGIDEASKTRIASQTRNALAQAWQSFHRPAD